MEILTLGSDTLRQKAQAIRPITGEHRKLAEDLIALMHQGRGIGLAGPQVGILKRLFVVHVEGDQPRVFINPSIIETSEDTAKYEEGCLSIPGVYAEIVRPRFIRVQAWNEKGRPFTLAVDGLLARVVQHEYDHLEGALFIDRLSEPKRARLLDKYEKLRRV